MKEKTIVKKEIPCSFCGSESYDTAKHPGFGLICQLCILKLKCFQMF